MGWHPERINQSVVSQSSENIAVEFAKGSDTLVDDFIAGQTGKGIALVLNKLLGPPSMAGLEGDEDLDIVMGARREDKMAAIKEKAKAMGLGPLPAILLRLLSTMAWPLIEKFLSDLFKNQRANPVQEAAEKGFKS